MTLFVDIVQPLSLPGGLSAPATVNAPSLRIDEVFVASALTATASVNQPDVIIAEGVLVTPSALGAAATVNAPALSVSSSYVATALSTTASIRQPNVVTGLFFNATALAIESQVIPPKLQLSSTYVASALSATVTVNPPQVNLSPTFQAAALSTTTSVNAPSVLVGKIVTPAALAITTSVNDPVVLTDRLILPPPFELTAVVNQPTLSGDLLFSVTDPPWNVIGIQLIFNMDYADVQREHLPNMAGTLLYQWHNGVYNGQDFNWTGGRIVDTLNGNTVDPDQIFNVLYTIVARNPGTIIEADIEVLNLIRRYEINCQDTNMDETAELLAALLAPDVFGVVNPCGVTWARLDASAAMWERQGASNVTFEGCGV